MTTIKMNRPILVLDKAFNAYTALPVHKAFTRVVADRAEFIDELYNRYSLNDWVQLPIPDGEGYIQSGRDKKVRIPEVLRFPHLNRKLRRNVTWCRKNLWKRDHFRCQFCGIKPRQDEITVDHVVPRKQGGISCFENCVLACMKCNLRKGHKTPEQANMPLIRAVSDGDGGMKMEHYDRPSKPIWSPLFSMPKIDKFPKSWKNFIRLGDDDLYWYVQLEN